MEFEEFKKIFYKELKQNNIIIDESLYETFYYYMKEIIKWNEKINVTSITDEKMFIVKHFVDSLTINDIVKDKAKLIDIGTGAGFPGIPLKFVNPKCNVTLIDSVNKKLNVIRDITEKQKITNLEIIHSRAEDLARNIFYREKYDVATTRAVSKLSTIAEYMLPFVKIGGIAVCMKGPNYEEELIESKNAIKILGGEIEKIETVNINDEIERNNIIIRKVNKTPLNYPRNNGKPLKEPIT
jgi:16S rRNA (guanine527-N7)-methyltransferase